ncbi:MAG TPA: hypothetical protein VLV83_16765 [Acidobacteriota bacterium]|nr:hypothetical protein [Acidobacteriota bacterium]
MEYQVAQLNIALWSFPTAAQQAEANERRHGSITGADPTKSEKFNPQIGTSLSFLPHPCDPLI